MSERIMTIRIKSCGGCPYFNGNGIDYYCDALRTSSIIELHDNSIIKNLDTIKSNCPLEKEQSE